MWNARAQSISSFDEPAEEEDEEEDDGREDDDDDDKDADGYSE